MTTEEIRKLPKIELHCHLDGSLSRKFIQTRLGRAVSEEELCAADDCGSLAEYLQKFELPGACLKDEEGLEGAGYDILETMSREHVCYAEIRFAPLLSVTEQMGTEQAIAALLKGLARGKQDFGVEYNVITCAMRHHSEERNSEMIKTARQFLGAGVCAADLAGAEAQYPMLEFMELFYKTKKLGMPFTIHAGECGNVVNITDAVQAGAKRIGHGIAMRRNPEVQKMVRDAGIGIEMCPLSNFQTKAVSGPQEYPLREFLEAGILVTVNTDNRTVSRSSMTKELELVQSRYGISDSEVMLLMRNAVQTAFTDAATKDRLLKKLESSSQLTRAADTNESYS